MIPLNYFLIVAALLFLLGIAGVLVRKNVLMMLMSIELMLNAANLTLVTFAKWHNDVKGHAMAFFVIAVAAAEAAVGLAIVVGVFRRKVSASVDDLRSLRN